MPGERGPPSSECRSEAGVMPSHQVGLDDVETEEENEDQSRNAQTTVQPDSLRLRNTVNFTITHGATAFLFRAAQRRGDSHGWRLTATSTGAGGCPRVTKPRRIQDECLGNPRFKAFHARPPGLAESDPGAVTLGVFLVKGSRPPHGGKLLPSSLRDPFFYARKTASASTERGHLPFYYRQAPKLRQHRTSQP